MKKGKNLLSVFLAMLMIFSVVPLLPVSATNSEGIAIGDTITLGTYNGESITWVCVDIDENGPLMMSEEVLCKKEYDAAGTSSKYHTDGWGYIRKNYGSNCWYDSNIRQWLNSNESSVSWTHCSPSYSAEAGFMTNFTSSELSVVKSITQKSYVNSWEKNRSGYVNGGSQEAPDSYYISGLKSSYSSYWYQNVTDCFFLLSQEQIYRIYKNNPVYLDSKISYWTRIAGNSGASYENVPVVVGTTVLDYKKAYEKTWGVRPAFYLDVETFNDSNIISKAEEEQAQYIAEHLSFVNSSMYNSIINRGFYNQIWQHEEGSRNFTRYESWDIIGDIGNVLLLNFGDIFKTENPYDIILPDVLMDYLSKTNDGITTSAQKIMKSIASKSSVYNDILQTFKTSEAWTDDLSEALAKFTKHQQAQWINGVFFDSSTFDLKNYDPALYNALSGVIRGISQADCEKLFNGLNNVGTIFDYINSGADIVFCFYDAYQKYLLAQTLYETNSEILAVLQIVADSMPNKASKLLKSSLHGYWASIDCDSAYGAISVCMMDGGLAGLTGNAVYSFLFKESLRTMIYGAVPWLAQIGGAYHVTYFLLDELSGLGKQSELHYLMNAAALLEKEYIKIVKVKATELAGNATLDNAVRFDTLWGLLQSLEGFCYKSMGEYASAFKQEYKANYIIKTTVTNNFLYSIIEGIRLKEDCASCDAAIQSVVYMESEWRNNRCHYGTYSNLKLVSVKCPTDVNVYDSENNLVLSIIENQITVCNEKVTAFVDGDEKIFVLPTDQKFDIKITATDDGTMTYGIKEFDNNDLVRVVSYENISLSKDKNHYGEIPTKLFVPTSEYDLISDTGEKAESTLNAYDDTFLYESTSTEKLEFTDTADGYIKTEMGTFVLHNWGEVTITNPNCTNRGKSERTCTVCGETAVVAFSDASGHNYTEEKIEPTCNKEGIITYSCSDCSDSYFETIPVAQHADIDNNGQCDTCDEITDAVKNCACFCHVHVFFGFIYMVVSWVLSLFGVNLPCDCGISHY